LFERGRRVPAPLFFFPVEESRQKRLQPAGGENSPRRKPGV